uniref:NADPH-dependent F420 reductase n=1 Tax=Nocardioides simplex TaxID=2045 RepID=Q8VPU7_NOCSI|nr:NADPH-dependent F420 reductase [Pimelobacter simplex]
MQPTTIAVVGGTGPQGRGLARWFAQAGHTVILGSRSAERASAVADDVTARSGATVTGASNADAVASADIVLIVVPWDGHEELVADLAPRLAGKLVVSCVNPLGFDKRGAYGLDVVDGSAAEQTQRLVPTATVVGAFHHLSAVTLWDSEEPLDHEDVLVCGDDADARARVLELATAVTGRAGIEVGPLRLAAQLEPLTAVLIGVNRLYKTRSGVALAGVPR